jgi:glycosyltransferase involved in cell wall biosynthesis
MIAADAHHRRPRVLHGITHLALGGAEQIAFAVSRGLSSRCDFGVFCACEHAPDAVGATMLRELRAAGVPVYPGTRWPMKLGGMIPAGRALARAVRDFRPDLIHLHTEIPESAAAAASLLSPALDGIPLARTIHNSVYWHPWRRLGRWCDRRLDRALIAGVSSSAVDAFQHLRQGSGGRPPPVAPRIIFNGQSLARFRRRPDRAPEGPVRLLFAGRFEPQKGADLLPEILSIVRRSPTRELELTIHGSGSHAPALRALAGDGGAGCRVSVQGPADDLPSRMADFDLLLLPSRFEGCCLTAIEAQAVGLPVVATDAPGLRETLPDGHPWIARAGDAPDFARALLVALGEAAQWPRYVRQSREHVERHFDAVHMCGRYWQLYEEAMAAEHTGARP